MSNDAVSTGVSDAQAAPMRELSTKAHASSSRRHFNEPRKEDATSNKKSLSKNIAKRRYSEESISSDEESKQIRNKLSKPANQHRTRRHSSSPERSKSSRRQHSERSGNDAKIPYFIDQRRERDRLRSQHERRTSSRRHRHARNRSQSPTSTRSHRSSATHRRRSRYSYSRSRSRSYSHSPSSRRHSRKCSHMCIQPHQIGPDIIVPVPYTPDFGYGYALAPPWRGPSPHLGYAYSPVLPPATMSVVTHPYSMGYDHASAARPHPPGPVMYPRFRTPQQSRFRYN